MPPSTRQLVHSHKQLQKEGGGAQRQSRKREREAEQAKTESLLLVLHRLSSLQVSCPGPATQLTYHPDPADVPSLRSLLVQAASWATLKTRRRLPIYEGWGFRQECQVA